MLAIKKYYQHLAISCLTNCCKMPFLITNNLIKEHVAVLFFYNSSKSFTVKLLTYVYVALSEYKSIYFMPYMCIV